jgi:hypothetical protein
MKVVRLQTPASMASLRLLEEDPPVPTAGEVLVGGEKQANRRSAMPTSTPDSNATAPADTPGR